MLLLVCILESFENFSYDVVHDIESNQKKFLAQERAGY